MLVVFCKCLVVIVLLLVGWLVVLLVGEQLVYCWWVNSWFTAGLLLVGEVLWLVGWVGGDYTAGG